MPLSTITNGLSGSTTRSRINAAFAQIDSNVTAIEGKSPTISTPKIYYVETSGNNATAEVGNPAKPYLTAQAAYDAGVTAAVDFVLEIGVGTFAITTSGASLSAFLKSVNGKGYDALSQADSASFLSINTTPPVQFNADGTAGVSNPTLHANNIALEYHASGGQVVAQDEIGNYTGGAGGSIHVIGNALWFVVANGGIFSQTYNETGYGGVPGSVIVEGGILNAISCQDGAGFNAGVVVPPSTSGSVTLRHVDAGRDNTTWGAASGLNVTAGCSTLPIAITPTNDKGGNASW